MERRKLRRRVQQQGESFDDYLVSLRELTKTCNFCSEVCAQKTSVTRSLKGDTVEHLLRQHDLTLATTITTCCAQEATKKQCKDIADHSVLAIRHLPKQPIRQRPLHPSPPTPKACPGCGLQPVAKHNAQLSSRPAATALRLAASPGFATVGSHNRSLQLPEPSQPRRKQTRSPWDLPHPH